MIPQNRGKYNLLTTMDFKYGQVRPWTYTPEADGHIGNLRKSEFKRRLLNEGKNECDALYGSFVNTNNDRIATYDCLTRSECATECEATANCKSYQFTSRYKGGKYPHGWSTMSWKDWKNYREEIYPKQASNNKHIPIEVQNRWSRGKDYHLWPRYFGEGTEVREWDDYPDDLSKKSIEIDFSGECRDWREGKSFISQPVCSPISNRVVPSCLTTRPYIVTSDPSVEPTQAGRNPKQRKSTTVLRDWGLRPKTPMPIRIASLQCKTQSSQVEGSRISNHMRLHKWGNSK